MKVAISNAETKVCLRSLSLGVFIYMLQRKVELCKLQLSILRPG